MLGLIDFGMFTLILPFVVIAILSLLSVGILCSSIGLIHYFFSLPMRRAEGARLFLGLLEDALKRGRPVEEMILSVAQIRERTVGVRFYLLAAHVENGLPFNEALKKVPSFLPPQISAMLLAGAELDDSKKVLPACREILRERPAGVRSAVHYMLLIILFFSPTFIGVITLMTVFVIPRFKDVAAGMGVSLWPLTRFVFALTDSFGLVHLEILLYVLLLIATVAYIGGPRFARIFQFRGFPIVDWIAWWLPWKQKKLQRTFSAMLAVLLDGGVPEAEAVRLAGDCTVNEICRHRARRVIAALQQGANLAEAVRAFDDSGEFHWRLTNAT
ncbi:MAG TPA: type II secretion system F family protein, partial [Candidatus Baltobacteraceae bacterium]|nr:type II secretion system F family protein [Candidatus Baltobacteraceae bacterium]